MRMTMSGNALAMYAAHKKSIAKDHYPSSFRDATPFTSEGDFFHGEATASRLVVTKHSPYAQTRKCCTTPEIRLYGTVCYGK